jgi:hypothetical protein
MRFAIYQAREDLRLQTNNVPLSEDNGKGRVGIPLKLYADIRVFQSDRPSNDQDEK